MNAPLASAELSPSPKELKLFDLLCLLHPGLEPIQVKIHFAMYNGKEKPIDVYLGGRFEEWQRWQRKLNFERPYVLSLIETSQKHVWMFAGLHRSAKTTTFKDEHHYYPLVEDLSCSSLKGRLFVRFEKKFRQCYPYAENHAAEIIVREFRDAPLSVAHFPGFRKVDLSYDELCLIHRQQIQDWIGALSSVAGVYLMTDTLDNKLYVGSASGQGGIWQRWADYAITGHGNNVELKSLLGQGSPSRARHFRYAILEIADIHDDFASIIERETHWKNILRSRILGLNRN